MNNIIPIKKGSYIPNIEVKGRTLVNLLGRAGNPIYRLYMGNVASDVTREFDGEYLKLTKSNSPGGIVHGIDLHRKHIVAGDCFIIRLDIVASQDTELSIIGYNSDEPSTKKFELESSKVNSIIAPFKMKNFQTDTPRHIDLFISNLDIGSCVKIKNVAIYKIDSDEFEYIKSNMNNLSIVEKYPYVDDIKCVINPYIESKENLTHDVSWRKGNRFPDGTLNPTTNAGVSTVMEIDPDTYTISCEGEIPLRIDVVEMKETTYGDVFRKEIEKDSLTFKNNVKKIQINVSNPNYTGSDLEDKIIESIYLNKTRIVLTKGDELKSYDECHNSRIMFETKLYEGETISRRNDGTYVKNSEYGEICLDSICPKKIINSAKGYKITDKIPLLPTAAIGAESHLVRYDGTIVDYVESATITFEHWYVHGSTTNDVVFILPNTLTGWGDNYTPTQEEIKAFFLGWRMYSFDPSNYNHFPVYNGESNYKKGWLKLWSGVGVKNNTSFGDIGVFVEGSNVFTCPTVMNDMGYTPYRLIYKKATPTIEEVKTHGSIVVKEDVDIKASSGLILSEIHRTFIRNVAGDTFINVKDAPSRLKYRLHKALRLRLGLKEYSFISGDAVLDLDHTISIGRGYIEFNEKHVDGSFSVDYLISEWDRVSSFQYKITSPNNVKEAIEKIVDEISNTNEKFSVENIELRNGIENLAQVGNPNLLINGDFQVWQRGTVFQNSGNLTTYTADRWRAYNDKNSKIEATKSGLKITYKDCGWVNLLQTLEMPKALDNAVVTLSAKLRCTTPFRFHVQRKLNDGLILASFPACDWKVEKMVIKLEDLRSYIFGVWTSGTGEMEIEWIKLELGDKATPLVPRQYAEELAMCQRYYQNNFIGKVYLRSQYDDMNAQSVTGFIGFNESMRITPTIKIIDGVDLTNSIFCGCFGFTTPSRVLQYPESNINGAHIGFDVPRVGVSNGFFSIAKNILEADAEIY